jgi:uncharacterized membrane protein YphA (DoxX/SURF4 family)
VIAGDFTSVGFMKIAKGPLTPVFRWMIWDGDGRARLDQEATKEAWNQYRQQVVDYYGFDEAQAKQAQRQLEYREMQLDAFFADNAEEIDKYFKGLERRDRNRQDAARREVYSLRGQAEQIEQELAKVRDPWLAQIDAIWKGLEGDLNGIANQEQQRRPLALGKPGRKFLDTVFIDQIIPTFDILVGACLILGLCTRITSLAGAGFLATIIATQWPGAEGAAPTYYQVIEMFGLLVLAAVGAGRWAGLDFLVHYAFRRCCPPKTEKN